MNLHRMLLARAAGGRPLRVGLIGAGKFGAMYLAQAKHTPGIHVVEQRGDMDVADLRLVQPEGPRDGDGLAVHAHGVSAGVRILGVDRCPSLCGREG